MKSKTNAAAAPGWKAPPFSGSGSTIASHSFPAATAYWLSGTAKVTRPAPPRKAPKAHNRAAPISPRDPAATSA